MIIIITNMFISNHITVGFHNLNLRIFNLRVSNPNKLIVDVFLTRCRISMCQGLGPKERDEISEIMIILLNTTTNNNNNNDNSNDNSY